MVTKSSLTLSAWWKHLTYFILVSSATIGELKALVYVMLFCVPVGLIITKQTDVVIFLKVNNI